MLFVLSPSFFIVIASSIPANSLFVIRTRGAGGTTYLDDLIQYVEVTNSEDPTWVNMGKGVVDSPMKFLVKSSSVGGYLYLTDDSGVHRRNVYIRSHMMCFTVRSVFP
jgi:hypothetical protein